LKPWTTVSTGFGRAMLFRRQRLGLSQGQAGLRVGLSGQYWGQIERAETQPTLPTAERIAEALEMELPALITEAITISAEDAVRARGRHAVAGHPRVAEADLPPARHTDLDVDARIRPESEPV
jgi:transcriptional regulator with XRE-family HTH domain